MPQQTRTEIEGKVTSFPYRTAMVCCCLIAGPSTQYSDLWQTLADTAGVEPDNHQVFSVENEMGTLYIMFSDDKTYIGTKIIEASW